MRARDSSPSTVTSAYLPDKESGKKTYAVAEPPEGGNVKIVPDGAAVFTVKGTKYYQFDNVFFKDKPGGGYVIIAEPADSEGDRVSRTVAKKW